MRPVLAKAITAASYQSAVLRPTITGDSSRSTPTRAVQATVGGTGNVVVQGRLDPSLAWAAITTLTATGVDIVRAYPEMRIAIDSNNDEITATIEAQAGDRVVPVITLSPLATNEDEDIADSVTIETFTGVVPNSPVWAIHSDPSGLFEIHPSTGVLKLKTDAALDHETAAEHTIQVSLTDSVESITSVVDYVLTVNDVADVSPVFTSADSVSVDEGIADTVTIYTATATKDVTGDTLAYSLTDDDGGKFEIVEATGVVTLADSETLDHETAASHEITVRADDGTNTTDLTVTINVNDLSETGPTFSSSASVTVGEHYTEDRTIIQVVAAAENGAAITYSIDTDADDLFEIGSVSGRLSLQFGKSLDYETKQSHSVTVEADDGDNQDTQVITITVTNYDEGVDQPVITSGATASADEDIGVDDVIYTATGVVDAGTIVWSISLDEDDLFEIDEDTGEVTLQTGASLDYETDTSHAFTVTATVGSSTADQIVTLTVGDISE